MTPAEAFAALVRRSCMSTLTGPRGLADRAVATLCVAGIAPLVHDLDRCGDRVLALASEVRAHGDKRIAQWEDARAAGEAHEVTWDRMQDAARPLYVFVVRDRVLYPEISRCLYQADLSAKGGALDYLVVMTPLAKESMRYGERLSHWPDWGTRATDLSGYPETDVLLAAL